MVITQADPLLRSLQDALADRLADAQELAGEVVPGSGGADGDTEACAEATRAALRSLDAMALDAPVSVGGMGLGLAASTAVAEALGRAALPTRYLAVAFAIDAAAAGDAPEHLLARLLADEIAVSVAGFDGVDAPVPVAGSATGPGPVPGAGSGTGSVPVSAGAHPLRLAGQLSVPSGTGSVLVPVELTGGRTAVVLLDLSTVAVEPVRGPSGAAGLVTLAGTATESTEVLCEWPTDPLAGGPLGRARIRQAGYLLGLAGGALATGVRHATARRQFGQPLRGFQSVAFRLAAGYVQIEALRLALARTVWLADTGPGFGGTAAEVLAQAAETATDTVRTVLQVCGARGMTAHGRVHRHYLAVRREARRLGRPGVLWRELGRDRLATLAGGGGW